jgi:hypothetical protein
MQTLASHITVDRQFLRSVRIDTDLNRLDAVKGYIFQPSASNLLETTAKHIRHTQQRGFTWTGAYGCGKSSLALVLGALAGGSADVRKAARAVLNLEPSSDAAHIFGTRQPWVVLPVVGKRGSIVDAIAHVIDAAKFSVRGPKPKVDGRRDVITELVRAAESQPKGGGVLLIVDELGKCLEHAAGADEDIGFYQELAEAASRSVGRLVVIGVLHQAFDQYAARLGRSAQEEWSKVQGRYVDIPLVAGSDEVLSLVGRAIRTDTEHKGTQKIASTIGKAIQKRRPSASSEIVTLLDACWPLHPVTAALLGPASKRRFSQNERSVFGFLASSEPLGFSEILKGLPVADAAYYWPSVFWDYLRTNFEPSILASADGHRWAATAEAVERAEARFSPVHVDLVKTVGLIELLRNGSGLAAEDGVLSVSVMETTPFAVKNALKELESASILIFRKHLDAWGVYAGSDFDIEAAVREARARTGRHDYGKLAPLVDLGPVTARRHYWETGAMRWFSRSIVRFDDAAQHVAKHKPSSSQSGEFILLLSDNGTETLNREKTAKQFSKESGENGLLIGVPKNAERIEDLSGELAALEQVRLHSTAAHGDSVALRELAARLAATKANLSDELRDAFNGATWYSNGAALRGAGSLSKLASDIADSLFPQTPRVQSELVNRNALSTSAAKAQKELLHAMVSRGDEERLGYQNFSADAGLFHTVVSALGLHRKRGEYFRFTSPHGTDSSETLVPAWQAAEMLVLSERESVTLTELYALWSARPFGIKTGLLPIFALCFFLAHRNKLALYTEGVFTPELEESKVDEWLQDSDRISWRRVQIDGTERKLLSALSDALSRRLGKPVTADAFDSARALVSMVFALPMWTRRTEQLSKHAKEVRTLLLKATDPHKVLFSDLPTTLDEHQPARLAEKLADLASELTEAFVNKLRSVEANLFQALDHDKTETLEQLRLRGGTVAGLGAEFRLDAFASRISEYRSQENDVEGLLMLAIGKPSRDWTDNDFNAGEVQLLSWAHEFRRLESLAQVRGRPATRRAIGVVFGAARTVTGMFDVSERDSLAVKDLANSLLAQVASGKVKREVLLAALAEAGAQLFEVGTNSEKRGKNG